MEKSMELERRLYSLIEEDRICKEEPMKNHTSFRVGGPAQYFVYVNNTEELQKAIQICKEENVPYFMIGNGTNLLVSDEGYRGVVFHLAGDFEKFKVKESNDTGMAEVEAGAGMSLVMLSLEMAKRGYHGLEFASGIPGTLGGAVVMNAGAYGGEIKDFLTKAEVLEEDGTIKIYTKKELQLTYRYSILQRINGIVTRAWFEFGVGSKLQMLAQMDSFAKQRREKQPLEFPSAGSTFKRPEGYYAGKLIMEAGLAGACMGDAKVSEKHCGFIVNTGNATAQEIYDLIKHVIRTVEEHAGVTLEPEVKFLGVFTES